jgi:hypothetical protein
VRCEEIFGFWTGNKRSSSVGSLVLGDKLPSDIIGLDFVRRDDGEVGRGSGVAVGLGGDSGHDGLADISKIASMSREGNGHAVRVQM